MTPRLFMKELKGVDFSCTSPCSVSTDATTTTTSISYNSILTSSGIGGRAIDRCSPRLRDPLRVKSLPRALPDKSKTFNQKAKKPSSDNKRSTRAVADPASSRRYLLSDCDSEDFSEQELVGSVTVNEPAELRFRSLKVEELVNVVEEYPSRFQSVKVEESKDISLPSSSSSSSTSKRAEEQKQDEEQHPSKLQNMKGEERKDKSLPAAASSTRRAQEQQVVVLRVSLHCKGCEGKVRKHISKMQGVTSFSTDLVNKKVTVIGEVTPLGVLNSISKVKNAHLWSS